MREFSPDFETHLGLEATQLCWCWQVIRKDGMALGFTDHDQDLQIGSLTYSARTGFTGADLDSKLGFSIDNNAVEGALSSDAISAADINAGIYERARMILLRVNWSAPETHAQIWRGHFGAISKSGDQYNIELVGESAILDRSTGRVFSKMCDAQFGDQRCGLDAASFTAGTTCPRTFAACRDQFSNTENYRGFPYLIGDDALQSGPNGSLTLDGGSRYT